MGEDEEYIANYRPDRLYLNPGQNGVYASMARESEVVLGEIDVTERFKIAVSAFYVEDRADFGTYKITKLKWQKRHGWFSDGSIQVNHFHLKQIREFNAIIDSIDLKGATKTRLDFDNINLSSLVSILGSNQGSAILEELSRSTELKRDVLALGQKRESLKMFREMLSRDTPETEWQNFFENNNWIFGYGMTYVFLDKIGQKLEAVTTGHDFIQHGKRADALMRTRAEVSQFVLIEIKRNRTNLLQSAEYRRGCWRITGEIAGAVAQSQKTVHEFAGNKFRVQLKDAQGADLPDYVFSVDPKSYLVVGSLSEVQGNDDKVACFELFRRNLRAPEIITFDELYYRAEQMLDNMYRNLADKRAF